MGEQYYECPKCGSGNIPACRAEYDEDMMWRVCECEDCGFDWTEVFLFLRNEDQNGIELDEKGNPISSDNSRDNSRDISLDNSLPYTSSNSYPLPWIP